MLNSSHKNNTEITTIDIEKLNVEDIYILGLKGVIALIEDIIKCFGNLEKKKKKKIRKKVNKILINFLYKSCECEKIENEGEPYNDLKNTSPMALIKFIRLILNRINYHGEISEIEYTLLETLKRLHRLTYCDINEIKKEVKKNKERTNSIIKTKIKR